MTTKKKKKTIMNAIDKYLLQKRYSQGKKTDENKKFEERVIRVVVPKIDALENVINATTQKRRSGRSVQTKTLDEKGVKKTYRRLKSVNINPKKSQNYVAKSEKVILGKSTTPKNHASAKSNVKGSKPEEKRRGRKPKLATRRKRANELKKFKECNKTPPGVDTFSDRENQVIDISSSEEEEQRQLFNSEAFKEIANDDYVCSNNGNQKHSENVNKSLPRKKWKVTAAVVETASEFQLVYQPCSSLVELPNNCNDRSTDRGVTEEITPITKKYQPYMERLKLLTSDAIQKFIKDNQQYYVDFKREVESKKTNISTLNKKMKKHDEMRDSFKCNPFSSDQQLTMYYTLREIFNTPNSHFKECRNFFTILIPEVSCQLFAETFRCSVSGAPRLIKKLYPNPICPI